MFACVALALGLAIPRSRAKIQAYLGRINTTGMVPTLVLAAGVAGGVIAMYLLFRSPVYAIYDRYLAPVWVLLAFLPVLVARLMIGRVRYVVVGVFVVLVMLPASLGRLQTLRNLSPNPGPALQAASHVVVDGPARGNCSRLFYWIPNATPVFVAWDSDLLHRPDAWLPELQSGDLYLHLKIDSNTLPLFLAMKRLIGTRYAMRARRDGVRGVGYMFVLTKNVVTNAGASP